MMSSDHGGQATGGDEVREGMKRGAANTGGGARQVIAKTLGF